MPASPDLVTYIIGSGVSGLILFDVCVTRKVVIPKWVLDRADTEHAAQVTERDKRIEDQQATISRLTDLAENQVIPALTRATDVNKDYLQLLQERRHDRR